MVLLKNGTQASDPRLDRLPNWDRRNLEYPIRQLFKADAKPRSYTWNFNVSEVLDQGQEGACVGFGFAHELMCKPRPVTGIDAYFAKHGLYWEFQRNDAWPGGSYPGADPFYEGTSVLDAARVMKADGWYDEYRWALSIEDLAIAVSHHGPAVIGVNWYDSMMDPASDGFLSISPHAEIAGGHCVLVRAVHIFSPGKYAFRIRNSWGRNWGIYGDAWISSDDMRRLHEEQGELCVPVVRMPRTNV